MLQIEIFENRNRSRLLCGGFPVCQRYTRRQKSLLYSSPLSPSSSGQGRHPFKVDITGSNPVGGTTAFEQVKACFSSWPVFVSGGAGHARGSNMGQTCRKPPQRPPRGQRKGPPPARVAAPPPAFQLPRSAPRLPVRLPVCLPLGYPLCSAFCSPLCHPRQPLGRSPLGYPSATPRALGLGYPLATPRRAPLPVRSVAPSPIAADRRARVQTTPSERRTAPPRNGPPLGARYAFVR